MDKRSSFLTVITLLFLFGLAPFSEAGEVVVIKSADIKPYNEAIEGFRSSLDDDMTEIVIAGADRDRVLREVHESGADVVFAVGMDALSLMKSVRNIPVVYAMVPRAQTSSLGSRPFSGVSMYIPPDRYIGAMLDVFQGTKRIGVIYDPRRSEAYIGEALRSAQDRGVELVLGKASKPSDIPPLIDSMKGRIDVFWMLPDTTVVNPETVNYLFLFSFRNKVPVFTFSRKYVEMGSAAGLYTSPFEMGVQAGEIARRLISEKNPKAIITDVRKTVLLINGKIAKKLDIKIRDDISRRAVYVD